MHSDVTVIDGGGTKLVVGVGDDGRLHQLSFGGVDAEGEIPDLPTALFPLALPSFGEEALRDPAVQVTHARGGTGTRLVVADAHQLDHDHGVEHRIVLRDRVEPLEVVACWRSWPEHGLIEAWTEVTNRGDRRVVVHRLASASPAVAGTDLFVTHWGGGWANEWSPVTEAVVRGTKTLASAGGVRASLYAPPVVVLSHGGPAAEDEGDVVLASIQWGGDVRFDVERTHQGQARLLAGFSHRGAARHLDGGECFVAPAAVLAWSDAGVGPISRRLHRWIRSHRVRDGDRRRAIAFNNWEAMGFALDTPSVCEVVDGAAGVGAELFLLDDGWFGTRYPRDLDDQGLGDWEVDRAKFPDGLDPVIERTLASGMRFGLWVEPEMVNPRSACYERHPDWVIAEPDRDRRTERHQLVLDLCQGDVADFVVDVVDRCLAQHPAITYLKWDANRDVFEAGSPALAPERQSHLSVDRVRATEEVMAEVAARHPDVELMLCASGGGRSNLGDLRWFHELWTSDNTDPVDRVRIQWGASHLLPALVLGAHVTRWGLKPLPFACAVAMSGRFGFDIDPRSFTDAEREVAAEASGTYRRIRDLVQFGDLHRLVSPIGSRRAALAYRAAEGERATVVFAFVLEEASSDEANRDEAPLLVVPGLDPARTYVVEEVTPGRSDARVTERHTGAALGAGALVWPGEPAPAARIWLVDPVG